MITKGVSTYTIIKDIKDLRQAQRNSLCRHIILEADNCIYIWDLSCDNKWYKTKYTLYYESKDTDMETTGRKAYYSFYSYCGKEEIERMKKVLPIIDIWESFEAFHYCNIEHIGEKIYKKIYEFDCNSSFTYGALQLSSDFDILKQYMLELYKGKESATTSIMRSRYKNLQNYLIGYFARIKEFVNLRSEIIRLSNQNIRNYMVKIKKAKGTIYLSNTDSIVTDEIGYNVMKDYLSSDVGLFKLEKETDRLYYKSSNAYQIGDKVVWSGIKYFARMNSNFFNDEFAEQKGSFIIPYDEYISEEDKNFTKLCKVKYGQITVTIYNSLGETIKEKIYKVEDNKNGLKKSIYSY